MTPVEVLARYDVGPILAAEDWGGTAGRTLRLRTPTGTWFLRRRGPRSSGVERIRFDHGLRRHLIKRGVPTAAPVATMDGADWVRTTEGVYELYPFVPGRAHRAGDAAEVAAVAETLAAFHAAGAEYRRSAAPPPPFEQFGLAAPGTPASGRIDDPACLEHAIRHLAADLGGEERRAALGMAELAGEVSRRLGGDAYDALDRFVVHGDVHPANLVFDDSGRVAGIFDLDWACPAPRLRDVADGLHFFAARPTREGADIRALTAPRALDPPLVSLFLGRYAAALPLAEAEVAALPWAWLARWLAMHTDGAYKVPPAERGRFVTEGVLEAARRIIAFDARGAAGSSPRP